MCLPSHSAIQAMFLATWHYRPAARAKLFVRNGCLLPWSTWHSPSVVGQWCSLSLQKLRYQYLASTWCNLIQELPCIVQTISDCRARFAQVFALIKKRSLAGLTCAHRGLSIDICTLVRNHTLADAKLLNKAVITDGPSRMPRSPSLPSLMTIQNLKHRRGKICPFLFEDIPRLWIAMIAMQMQCRRPFSTCWWDLQGVDTLLGKRRPSWTTPLEQASLDHTITITHQITSGLIPGQGTLSFIATPHGRCVIIPAKCQVTHPWDVASSSVAVCTVDKKYLGISRAHIWLQSLACVAKARGVLPWLES